MLSILPKSAISSLLAERRKHGRSQMATREVLQQRPKKAQPKMEQLGASTCTAS